MDAGAVVIRRLIIAACAAITIAFALGICAACAAIHHPEDGRD